MYNIYISFTWKVKINSFTTAKNSGETNVNNNIIHSGNESSAPRQHKIHT